MDEALLVRAALDAMKKSYSPYSRFCVGAALLTEDGEIYTGCNIENVSFSPTVCAERTAFFKAVSEGKKDFSAIAVAGGKNAEAENLCTPCGVCRQVMCEFCDDDFIILLCTSDGKYVKKTLGELAPMSFRPEGRF